MIIQLTTSKEKQQAVSEVLHALPKWFGMEESIQEYIQDACEYPVWASVEQEELQGVLVGKLTSDVTMELYVMGVKEAFQHQGIGTTLFQALYEHAKRKNIQFLQVKTIKEGCYTCYNETNAFYQMLGFQKLECFPTLWSQAHPCQLYVMYIGAE